MAPKRGAGAGCAAIDIESTAKVVAGRSDIWNSPYRTRHNGI